MVTKFSHVLGPVLVGLAALVSDEPKYVLLALVPLFVFGGLLLAVTKKPANNAI
jgi:MFS-type transporter involved in bile tolerance (Atg22 family)